MHKQKSRQLGKETGGDKEFQFFNLASSPGGEKDSRQGKCRQKGGCAGK